VAISQNWKKKKKKLITNHIVKYFVIFLQQLQYYYIQLKSEFYCMWVRNHADLIRLLTYL
jgi:hypothetical protein